MHVEWIFVFNVHTCLMHAHMYDICPYGCCVHICMQCACMDDDVCGRLSNECWSWQCGSSVHIWVLCGRMHAMWMSDWCVHICIQFLDECVYVSSVPTYACIVHARITCACMHCIILIPFAFLHAVHAQCTCNICVCMQCAYIYAMCMCVHRPYLCMDILFLNRMFTYTFIACAVWAHVCAMFAYACGLGIFVRNPCMCAAYMLLCIVCLCVQYVCGTTLQFLDVYWTVRQPQLYPSGCCGTLHDITLGKEDPWQNESKAMVVSHATWHAQSKWSLKAPTHRPQPINFKHIGSTCRIARSQDLMPSFSFHHQASPYLTCSKSYGPSKVSKKCIL